MDPKHLFYHVLEKIPSFFFFVMETMVNGKQQDRVFLKQIIQ
jgi:hypothetical protein